MKKSKKKQIIIQTAANQVSNQGVTKLDRLVGDIPPQSKSKNTKKIKQ